jgi:galactokinase
MRAAFETRFGHPPAVVASAPGRVILIGDHTGDNDGYVLPTAIPQSAIVSVGASRTGEYAVCSVELDEAARFTLDRPPPHRQLAGYVHSCVRVAADHGAAVAPIDVCIESAVPVGVGLSSGAALRVAMLRALRDLWCTPWDDMTVARLAQQAAIQYAGMRCGIADPMACSLAAPGSMLFLDVRTLERRLFPLPAQSEILIVNSGIPRTFAGTAHAERRAECEAAARALGVQALRDVADTTAAENLPASLALRARHVISENTRVLEAARGIAASRFGQLMNESHGSLRDDYQVSLVAVDQLVELLQSDSAVYGARLTGAGFGGACVALCHAGKAATVGERVVTAYNASGAVARVLVPASPSPSPSASGSERQQ